MFLHLSLSKPYRGWVHNGRGCIFLDIRAQAGPPRDRIPALSGQIARKDRDTQQTDTYQEDYLFPGSGAREQSGRQFRWANVSLHTRPARQRDTRAPFAGVWRRRLGQHTRHQNAAQWAPVADSSPASLWLQWHFWFQGRSARIAHHQRGSGD